LTYLILLDGYVSSEVSVDGNGDGLQKNEVSQVYINLPNDSPVRTICFRSEADDGWSLDRIEIDDENYVYNQFLTILPGETKCLELIDDVSFSPTLSPSTKLPTNAPADEECSVVRLSSPEIDEFDGYYTLFDNSGELHYLHHNGLDMYYSNLFRGWYIDSDESPMALLMVEDIERLPLGTHDWTFLPSDSIANAQPVTVTIECAPHAAPSAGPTQSTSAPTSNPTSSVPSIQPSQRPTATLPFCDRDDHPVCEISYCANIDIATGFCPRLCGMCLSVAPTAKPSAVPTRPLPPSTQPSEGCYDLDDVCEQLTNSVVCQDPFVSALCPKTCYVCMDPTEPPTNAPTQACADLIDDCEIVVQFPSLCQTADLRANCQASCYLCDQGLDWDEWSDWGDCSRTCGPGLRSRTRTCDGIIGTDCIGSSDQNAACPPPRPACMGTAMPTIAPTTNTRCVDANDERCEDAQINPLMCGLTETFTLCRQTCNNCPESANDTCLILDLTFDDYPEQTQYEIRLNGILQISGDGRGASGTLTTDCVQVSPADCIEVTIYDGVGNGMCCENGNGFHTISIDDTVLHTSTGEFGLYERNKFQNGRLLGDDEECASDELTSCLQMIIEPDGYPAETSYRITQDNFVLASGQGSANVPGKFGETSCLSVVQFTCVKIEIFDSHTDGICCEYGNGFYYVTWDGVQIYSSNGQYGAGEAIYILDGQMISQQECDDNHISG